MNFDSFVGFVLFGKIILNDNMRGQNVSEKCMNVVIFTCYLFIKDVNMQIAGCTGYANSGALCK